jgi:poly-gamma-glutamate synthesis protein (capsule biosynthesis protein)
VFESVAHLLDGDWLVANLETPLADLLPDRDPRAGYFFGATQAMAEPLSVAGFDAVTLANNHAADLGVEGLRQTPRLLQELGIRSFGAAALPSVPIVESVDVDGVRIGVVAVTTNTNFEMPEHAPAVPMVLTHHLEERVGPLLEAANPKHDLMIVLLHWGVEYSRYPEIVQRQAARALVDHGADLVIGHHPHVLQEIELHHGGVIAYSLGNFLFENLAPEPRLTGVLAIDVERPSLCDVVVRFHPAVMRQSPFFHPEPAVGGTARLVRLRVPPKDEAQAEHWLPDGEALVARTRRKECTESP